MSDALSSYDVSHMQAGMLFHSLYSERTGVYVQQVVATLDHELDVAAFMRAWSMVVERHDLFRTSFHWSHDGKFVQRVRHSVKVPFLLKDWKGLADSEQAKRLESYLEKDKARGFELTEPPLMRLALFRSGNDRHKLIWSYHHALLDGRSRVLVLKELFAIYESLIEGREIELDYVKPYRDYVSWLKGLHLSKAEEFWRTLLDGFVKPTPLPGANLLGQLNTSGVHSEKAFSLSEELTSRLGSIATENGITLNTILQGAWALLLSAHSGSDDVVFGATRACRRSTIEGAESMIGLFINTVPVRVRIKPEVSLLTWLGELRAQHIAVRDFEHTPLVTISACAQVGGGASLFDSIVVFENHSFDAVMKAQGGEWRKRSFELLQRSNYPITLAAYRDRELLVRLEYDVAGFDEQAAVRLTNQLRRTLQLIAEDAGRRLADLETLSPEERHQIFIESNDTALDYPSDILFHELFEQQARLTPDDVAVVCREENLTYSQLNESANRLAHYLIESGAGPEVIVGICLPRGIDLVVSVLGVLKSGSAYLPLDPSHPDQRLALMAEQAGARLLLTKGSIKHDLGHQIQQVDVERSATQSRNTGNPARRADPQNPAYVIYTSGSTGTPKGAMIHHRSVVNLLTILRESVYANAPERPLRISLNGSVAFDTSIKQLVQLASGHAIHVVPEEIREDPEALMNFVGSGSLDVFDCTPSALQVLIDCGLLERESLPSIILVGGEAVDAKLWQLLASAGTTAFYNVYGPTETTVNATVCFIESSLNSPVIGRPLGNIAVYILNERLGAVEKGAVGELFIAGAGVGRGYIGRPEQSAASFLPDPYGSKGNRMYRTGDICRYREDWKIEYLCRKDDQVKIRGYRVEPGEVEAALRRQKAVRQAAVLVKEDSQGSKKLVGYVVAGEGVRGRQLRECLRRELPEYMVPETVAVIAEMPLTTNGKLDRKRLQSMPEAEPDQGTAVEERPATAAEQIIAGIWQEVLKRESVGVTQNFFDLGGHSLLATQVIVRVRKAFGIEIALNRLFEKATVKGLAQAVEQIKSGGTASSIPAIRKVPRLGGAAAQTQKDAKNHNQQAHLAAEHITLRSDQPQHCHSAHTTAEDKAAQAK